MTIDLVKAIRLASVMLWLACTVLITWEWVAVAQVIALVAFGASLLPLTFKSDAG